LKIKEIINDENHENLYLNKVTNELGLHPVYLSRKFPEYFNMNFGDYIGEKKLEHACLFFKRNCLLI